MSTATKARRHRSAKVSQPSRRLSWPHLPLGETQAAWVSRVLLAAAPMVSFTLVEFLNYNNPWTDFTPAEIILNLLWYYAGEALLYLLLRRRTSAVKWGMGIAWGLGCVNHYLLSFRGRTLFPGDLLTLGTALNVAGQYNYAPDRKQWITLGILVVCLAVISLLPEEEKHDLSWKRIVPVTALCALYAGVFFGTDMVRALDIEPSVWTTRENGLVLNFTVCLKYMRIGKPEGYSKDRLTAISERYPGETAVLSADQPVNVIVVMNESFADLTVLPGVESSQEAMPFIRSLTENTVKGYAYTSVFGGTTANSEYEFLTGNSMALLPAGTVPYQMYVSAGDPSLVGQMKSLGYRCVASHPYRSSGWNRPAVYRGYGFDEIYFERDFQDREYMRGDAKTGYVSDQSNFENLVRMYEEKTPGERLFLFNVTMQNHSSYRMEWDNLERTATLAGELEGRFATVDQYFSLVYASDKAFEYLVTYFAQVEEPTVILMFGDHQPQVATNFYTDVLGEDPDLPLAQRKQMTPFILWANYDIPERDGVELSLNYLSGLLMETAGLPLSGYQQFQKDLYRDLPVINALGLRDGGGNWYELEASLPDRLKERLTEYQILQYNNIFDKGRRVDTLFSLR